MAESIEDILARRVRLLFLDARAAMDSASRVADIFVSERGWEEERKQKEISDFLSLAKGYLLTPYKPKCKKLYTN